MRLGVSRTPIEPLFWTLSPKEVASTLTTNSETGLTSSEAAHRLQSFGPNVIERLHETPVILIFFNQFKSALIVILLGAGAVTAFLGHYRDAGFISAALIVNVLLGFYQEFKAEKALSELKTYLKQRARVIREGREHDINAAELVPGDLVQLTQGDRVPADARLIFVNDLQIDEAILTGESLAAVKVTESVTEGAALGDQRPMVFAGTLVTEGVGTAIVCRTGLTTEIGKIATLVADSTQEETPLQREVRAFSVKLGVFLFGFTLLIFIAGILLGHSVVTMFLTAVAVAVAAVPEGLPIAMTVILAIGVERMAKRKGVVRKLVAAEALGSATVIVTDKTGTLTEANMKLRSVEGISGEDPLTVLTLALQNTNVLIENPHDKPEEWRLVGRIIETALVRSAGMRGIVVDEVKRKIVPLSTLPFNAVNKFSASFVREGEREYVIYLGAPDILVTHSTLSVIEQEKILQKISALAASGELVIGVATKDIPKGEVFSFSKHPRPSGIVLRGLFVLRDPIRETAADAIHRLQSEGVRMILMTGDHRGTAEAVAREVGIPVDEHSVIDAETLRTLSDEALSSRLAHLSVVSRASPFDKMRVVGLLQAQGEIVAMTGDGVNDAPSIKKADIGIAMGSGTEVARDVADLVLLDDNVETIVAAVEEGRQIMRNIRKVLVYLLSSVADGLILIGGALAFGLALPLTPLQILWVNFFSDSFPAIAFAFERDTASSRHVRSGSRLLTPLMQKLIVFIGLITSVLLFALYGGLLSLGYPEDVVRTFIFASFGTYTLFVAFSLRSLEKSIFSYNPLSNTYLALGVSVGVILMLAAVYIPFLQVLFDTVPLSLPWAIGVGLVGVLNILLVEAGKWLFHRREDTALTQGAPYGKLAG